MKTKWKIVTFSAGILAGAMLYHFNTPRLSQDNKPDGKVAYIKAGKNASSSSVEHDEEQGEQIVVKITDEGYVTSHGDHFHYYDGKVPYDALISEELILNDPNYVLDPSHIVNEVKNGYILKIDGKYYLYLKDKNQRDNVRSKAQIEEAQKQGHGASLAGSSSNHASRRQDTAAGKKESGYHTDDGYVFNLASILEDTGDGYIVAHGNHKHYIPKSQLSGSELAAAQAYMAARNGGGQLLGQGGTNGPNSSLATSPSLSPSIQPFVPSQPQPNNRPSHQGKDPKQTEDQKEDWQTALAKLEALPEKDRFHDGDGLLFNPRKIVKRTQTGVVIPHGDHFHFIAYSQLSPLEALVARSIPIASNQPQRDNSVDKEEHGGHGHQDGHEDHNEHEEPNHHEHHEDHEEEDFHFDPSMVLDGDKEGYMVGHGNHAHYIYKKDLTAEEIAAADKVLASKKKQVEEKKDDSAYAFFSRDASDEEKIAYISKTYGVPLEAIKISQGYFVFNNPDQAYDPTHIHPYAVRKEHVRIPLETGNEELDFLNELYATALRSGLSPYSIAVENGKFVIPHGDHNHYLTIQSKGVTAALKNKLKRIDSSYQPGDLDKKQVEDKVEELLKEAKESYSSEPLTYRRIEMALGAFKDELKLFASNSTAGYLTALEAFKQKEILGKTVADTGLISPLDVSYQKIRDRLALVDTDQYGYSKEDLLKQLQDAKLKGNFVDMQLVDQLVAAIEDYRDRKGITSLDYLKFFYLAAENDQISSEDRKEAADLALKLYRSQASLESIDLDGLFPSLYRLRKKLGSSPSSQAVAPSKLDEEKLNGRSYKYKIHEFLTATLGDFAPVPTEKLDEEELKQTLDEIEKNLAKLKESSFKDQSQASFLALKSKELKTAADLSQALYLLDQVKSHLQEEAEDAKPDDLESYSRIYQKLMGLHQYLIDKDAADAYFDQVDAYLDRLANPSEDKATLEAEVEAFASQIKARADLTKLEEEPVSDKVASEVSQPAESTENSQPNTLAEDKEAASEGEELNQPEDASSKPALQVDKLIQRLAQDYGVDPRQIKVEEDKGVVVVQLGDQDSLTLDLASLIRVEDLDA